MRSRLIPVAAIAAAVLALPAAAQGTKVAIGISGWTGFAPLTLANEAGLFKKRGVDASLKKIPVTERHLAIASGDVQCAATTIETFVAWNANGVPVTAVVQLDKSYGADGLVARNAIGSIKDLKGKTVGVQGPGSSPYFGLAWMLKKNGLTMKDITIATMSPQAAAQAFIAGQNDAAFTYEPYLSSVRDKPEAGKILATTIDYPMVMDALGCTPKFIKENPKAVQAMVEAYFEALEMIKTQPAKSNEIMGADVKQTGDQFAKSASYLRWQDKAANQKFFSGELQAFAKESGALLVEIGTIKSVPDVATFIDASFIK
ncbi:MAG: ABC transporter substrate-binding protein [Betaproteobacteria bacterium]|nr:ABC transporter substrate-binding protein [Betaproteobacteria bacterium]